MVKVSPLGTLERSAVPGHWDMCRQAHSQGEVKTDPVEKGMVVELKAEKGIE